MACKPHLEHKTDGNRVSFTATCLEKHKCDDGDDCKPAIKGLTNHDKRYNLTHSGAGARDADAQIEVVLPLDKGEEVVVEAVCMCGDKSSEPDPYSFTHNPELTGERFIEDLWTAGHALRKLGLGF